jgi:RNA polymerase-binding transcription factor DksA
MQRLSRLAAILLLVGIVGAASAETQSESVTDQQLWLAQNQMTSPNLYSNSASQVISPTILPEAPGTVNGGNPFQGLGRPDDTGPLRANPIQQYMPGNNTNGLFSTGSSFPSTPSVEQPGFGGQAGFSSNNTSNDPGTGNPALNQSSIPALNQAAGETNPGPNAALIQNLNPLPQSLPGDNASTSDRSTNETAGDTRANQLNPQSAKSKNDKEESSNSESGLFVDKLLTKSHQSRSKSAHDANSREANQLATALKEMNNGNYTKCLETLNTIIKNEPNNAQAYYVKAVTNVLTRDFAHARQNYEMTLRCTNDEQLIAKTKAGLLKLGR